MLFFASSLRMLARTQPPWTKTSLPSGRTSLIVACRSTSGRAERALITTLPAPITVVSSASGSVMNEAAVPSGCGSQW